MAEQQFAQMVWEPRWNTADVIGFYDYDAQHGTLFSTGPMGVVRLRPEDVEAYVAQMRAYVNGLERYVESCRLRGAWGSEGMRLTILGCSGSVPGPDSPASGYLLQSGRHSLCLDLGNGTLSMLQQHLDPMRLEALALSHLHPDHCADVSALVTYRRWCPDREPGQPVLPVYGPSEVEDRITSACAASVAELSATDLSDVLDFRILPSRAFTVGPFRVTTAPTAHYCEAYAFRVECDGASLVYTGDTGPCQSVLDLARGADVLLSEATWTHDRTDPPTMHLSGRQAGELAREAGVGRLLLTHVAPWVDQWEVLDEARQAFGPNAELVSVGGWYDL